MGTFRSKIESRHANDLAARAEAAGHAMEDATWRARRAARRASRQMRARAGEARHYVRAGYLTEDLGDLVRSHPYAALAIGLVTGYAVTRMLLR
jgi:ElaB/YqjD/DUF883 family membrane-anchored ribosome-binding protein